MATPNKKHPFLAGEERKRRSAFNAVPVLHEEIELNPVAGTNLATDRVLTFNYKTGHASLKLYEFPIVAKGKFSLTGNNGAERQSAAADGLILSPYLQASALIRGIDVIVNQVLVYSSHDGLLNAYQCVSARTCCEKIKSRFLQGYSGVETSTDDESSRFTVAPANTQTCLVGQLPGVPFLGYSRNVSLESMYHKAKGESLDLSSMIIPPNTDITFVFTFHENKVMRVSRDDVNIQQWENAIAEDGAGYAAWALANLHPAGLKFTLTAFKLRGTKMQFSEKNVQQELTSSGMSFSYDCPLGGVHAIPQGMQHYEITFQVPKACHIVYVAFLHYHALVPHGRIPADCSKFTMMPDLTNIKFLLGESVLLFRDGIDVSRISPHTSTTFQQYYHYAQASGFLSEYLDFDDFAPTGGNDRSFNNIFVLPIVEYDLKEMTRLTVQLSFNGAANSPANWSLVFFHPQERIIKRKNGFWTAESP